MDYQLSLFNADLKVKKVDGSKLKVIAWNIQNPSKDRANKQLRWIYDMNPDIIVLTEVTLSEGFILLKAELEMQDYQVIYKNSDSYFTLIAVKNYVYDCKYLTMSNFSERVNYIEIKAPVGMIAIVGVYAPTCSRDIVKINDKKRFHEELYNQVVKNIWNSQPGIKIIITGDLNFLEPGHKPIYCEFASYYKYYQKFNETPFKDLYRALNPDVLEYSWSGQGKFQRLDHVFVTENVLPFVDKVEYLKSPRKNKISDHSALYIEINFNK